MSKGDDTRRSILDQALDLSSEVGLEAITVGVLAKRVGMSKSGLYAHFASKEELQCQVLDTAAERFVDQVLAPALKQARGIARVETLFEQWAEWTTNGLSGGCPFIGAATEFDDREGPVRDRLVAHLGDLRGALARAAHIAVEEGHFREDLDVDQFAFEFWGILLAHHHFTRLLLHEEAATRTNKAFRRLIAATRAV